jgi:hypothetical protein
VSTGLRELLAEDVDAALEQYLTPRLAALLTDRQPGHCMRADDLEPALAARLCRRLRLCSASAQLCVLAADDQVPADVAVTSTKLVELRNPLPDGQQRPPLLVFVPPGARASAEDSFGVATFEQLSLGDVYAGLGDRILAEFPATLRLGADDLLAALAGEQWRYATPAARARYLLTVKHNDYDPAAAGAAIFELGLIPDFDLFTNLPGVRPRVLRNLRQVRTLTDSPRTQRQRVIELGLADASFRARLAELITELGLENPRTWTRAIVVDRSNWGLAFGRWPVSEDAFTDTVRIQAQVLGLPTAGDQPEDAENSVLATLTGQPYLPAGPNGAAQLAVSFSVSPDPQQIRGLGRFSVQLIGEDTGPTGAVASVRPSRVGKADHKATLKKLRKASLEEGWHFIRVVPLDADGIPLPTERETGAAHPGNETARFYVLPGGTSDEPPEQPARREPGLSHALFRLQFDALADDQDPGRIRCTATGWKRVHGHGRHTIVAVFGAAGVAEIPVPGPLADLEQRILSEPDHMGSWRWELGPAGSEASRPTRDAAQSPHAAPGEAMEAFLSARRLLFEQIRGDSDLVAEGCDLASMQEPARVYAEAYAELLAWQMRYAERSGGGLKELASLLQIDTTAVGFADDRGNAHELVLVAPTHPLRMLWLATWAELGRSWLRAVGATDGPAIRSARDTLLDDLTPLGFPLVVPRPDGRLTVAAHDLTFYWGTCLPAGAGNPQSVLTTLAESLHLPDRWPARATVSGDALADQVERYLRLHPYVQTLTLAAVNPGNAGQLADMLVKLQRRPQLRDVRYDIRLFLPDPQAPDAGEAMASLLRGEWGTAEEAEAFRTPAISGLVPKLAVAARPLTEFRSPAREEAVHITLLFDAFSGEQIDAAPSDAAGTVLVHGLIQDMKATYVEDEDTIAWHKQPRQGQLRRGPGVDEPSDLEVLTEVMTSLPALVSRAAAAVATGQAGTRHIPRITLALDVADRTLLHEAHRSSDWVITIDRTMGVEYFDSPPSLQRPEYIIDYAPTGPTTLTHQVVISSQSVSELQALLAPAIAQHQLAIDPRHVTTFFEQLRQLSGRLAFKIASAAPTQRTEILGLALARLYLDYQGALADQILIPLDAHLELYRDARRRVAEIADAAGLHRTDLAFFDLDAARRTITCRLVEVKCLSSLIDLSVYAQLKEQIIRQLDRSATVLSEHFDPGHNQPDRPDRPVKNVALAALLRFYLDRAARYQIITPEAREEAQWLLDRLDDGYRLLFTRTGLIFDLSGTGTDTETEAGVEFHRIGRNQIRELLNAIPTDPLLAPTAGEYGETRGALPSLTAETLTVPRLAEAAFHTRTRNRFLPYDNTAADGQPPPATPGPDAMPELTATGDTRPPAAAARPEAAEPAGQERIAPTGTQPPPPTVPAPAPRQPEPSAGLPAQAPAPAAGSGGSQPDVYLGVTQPSPQYGVLGDTAGRLVALDLNETHTISLFGVQGGGKSYTLGTVIEMASLPAPPANLLPRPLATIVFHYSPTQSYAPEFTSMVDPNDAADQIRLLTERYGVQPSGLQDVVMLVPEDRLAQRRAQYPAIEMLPLKFGSMELRAEHWRFLMGAVGNQATYIRQLQRIMRAHRSGLSLGVIRDGVEHSNLPDHLKQLAQQRLDLASDYIDDQARIKDLARPGRVIIVDLRDEFIEKDEALGLFVVLMQLFADARDNGRSFNKLVVFDEAHKYIDSPDLVSGLVEAVREMRHKGLSVLIASQDPPSIPISLIELSDHVILHKFTSPAWLKHLQKANAALADLNPAKMAGLAAGEAYMWASKATDPAFTRGTVKIRCRPRITRHGGSTKTAVG